jgi:putative acetyltransferase
MGTLLAITIRPYEDADAPVLAQLFFDSVRSIGRRFYTAEQVTAWAPAPADPEGVRARAGDGRTTLVAVNSADEVVGYGDLEPDGHLDHLYCRPDAVGSGVGAHLLDQLIAIATAQGSQRVRVEASEGARRLFERKGFTLVARRDFTLRNVPIHNYLMERVVA